VLSDESIIVLGSIMLLIEELLEGLMGWLFWFYSSVTGVDLWADYFLPIS